MYLKRLELQGFKSFADRTVLEFMPGITSVIGPNGSGKSNISDAIRWVLGEQSMKSLRGSKSEDIIFAGTQNRKSLGFAEASLVFDNSDRKLPVEYTEVVVTRKIYRSGESGYFINKVPCRLKDVLELFMDTGIGKDGYSIIGQGKIDEILSNKSEDRRHIFEEAAGIVKYRVRKVETEKKLEHTKLNLLRINDILAEIETTIGPLKVQSEKAKKFLDLREELKSIEVGLFIQNIENYTEKIKQMENDEGILKNNVDEANINMEKINSLKESLKIEIDDILNRIDSMQNIGLESQKAKEKLNSEINVINERIANNKDNYERYNNEIEELNLRNNEFEEQKEQKETKKTRLTSNKERFLNDLKEKEEELEKLNNKLSTKELEIEDKKKIVENSIDEKYELSSDISGIDANYEGLSKRESVVKSEIRTHISELDQSRVTKNDIEQVFKDIEFKRNKLVQDIDLINAKKEKSDIKTKEFDDKINEMSNEFRIKESRLKFLQETEKEKEGYIRSVKALLNACDSNPVLNKGNHGILANIISVDKEFEVAIEMCLGQTLQNIVTETEQDAKRLVEYLRENKLGRASFLPISTVKGRKLDKLNSKHVPGVYGIASDLVKVNKKYESIILSLLGRTVVVDDMQNAILLAKQNNYSFRIITLKGDIINPSGSITGGSVAQKTVNILGRAREIEDLDIYLVKLKSKIEKLNREKEEYEDSLSDILEESVALEKDLQEIDITYATDKQKLLSVEENIHKLEDRISKLKEELENIFVQRTDLEKEKSEKEVKINELNDIIEKLNIEIEQFTNLNKDNQKYIDDLNSDVVNLKISVSSFDESEASIEEFISKIELDIQNNKDNIENKEKLKAQIIEDNEKLKINIEDIKEQIKKIDEDVLNSGSKVEELKNLRISKSEELTAKEKDVQKQFEVIEDLKAQVVKLDVKKNKAQEDLDEVYNKLWDEYELTPNNAKEYKKPTDIKDTTKKVNELRASIKELGSVNIDSIEEYKEVGKRYDFMCEQRLDLENGMEKLKKIISNMTNIMKDQFREQFTIINRNFGEVFKELFGGGKAELTLTDENNILECGIEIKVQPPGKKLQSMTLLSGGEKAFTAIALLFAILKINPAPFCVLDEIEAALDDVNVYRYADYLKKFSNDTQFLIITHRKGTMEVADTVYGVTMEENGISKLLSMQLKDALKA